MTGTTGVNERSTHHRQMLLLTRVIGLVLIMSLMIRLTWLSDDALITLRHALNATHGWGLGFNAAEAVQGYTHPLWYLLVTAITAAAQAPIIPLLLANVFFAIGAVLLIMWRVMAVGWMLVGFGLLAFSNAFMEYSSSGLENSVAYFAFAVALLLTLSSVRSVSRVFLLGLAGSAILLTRFDFVLLLTPVLLVSLWGLRHSRRLMAGLLAGVAVPIVVWSSWALSVYGELLPNTYWAKRNVEIPQFELLVRGMTYVWVSFSTDPVSFLAVALGLAFGLVVGNSAHRAWAIGIAAYVAYVVWIGGDHMVGRHLAVPVFVSVGLLLAVTSWHRAGAPKSARGQPAIELSASAGVVSLTAILVLLGVASQPPVSLAAPQERRWDMNDRFQIQDERGLWAERGYTLGAFLAAGVGGDAQPTRFGLVEVATAARDWPQRTPSEDGGTASVDVICGGLGTYAILSGPGVHWIDTCALTDAFLARRTFSPPAPYQWFMGHFEREIPAGYRQAIETGDVTKVVDTDDREELERLWQQIR